MLLSTLITPRKESPIRVAFFDDRIEIENPESKHNLQLSGSTPSYLSIDFYSRQPEDLRDRNCYVIRTGKGNFTVIDENSFKRAIEEQEQGSGFRGFRGSGCLRGR